MSGGMKRLAEMDYAVLQQCMHCGMCLPTCPTYVETKKERNSPRGRIAWMRAIADGEMSVDEAFADEMYYCLGCLACTTACPAGVDYPTLFETARAEIEREGAAPGKQRIFWRWLTVKTLFMHPRLLRLAGRGLYLYQRTGLATLLRKLNFFGLLPKRLRELEKQTPTVAARFSHQLIKPQEKAPGTARYRVGLLTGCVQDLVFSAINRDTADVLLANGCDVVTPAVQPCCGSLHAHNGETALAQTLARRLIDQFDPDSLDAIITNAGGCGSHLKHFGELLADDPAYAERARQWDLKCKDIHEWLDMIGLRQPTSTPPDTTTVAYHESCHLCHGQKIRTAPRRLLDAIPGLKRVELAESDWCCGSAGIYNITQPEQAAKLLERKFGHINATGADIVATSNPGCHLQLQNGLTARQSPTSIEHPVTLLAKAYRRELDKSP
jgi:glycolate oxidase iron-sulfur subunit